MNRFSAVIFDSEENSKFAVDDENTALLSQIVRLCKNNAKAINQLDEKVSTYKAVFTNITLELQKLKQVMNRTANNSNPIWLPVKTKDEFFKLDINLHKDRDMRFQLVSLKKIIF